MSASEPLRTATLTACAFAKVFIESADAELRGASSIPREEAQLHLVRALANIWRIEHNEVEA